MEKNQYRFNVVKNYLHENRLRWEGVPVEPGAKPPVLILRVSRNNPKFDCYLNSPSYTKDYGKIGLCISTVEMYELIELINNVINNSEFGNVTVKYYDFKWYGKQKSKEKEFIGSITVGRDNGIIFIGFNFGDGIDKPKFMMTSKKDTIYYNNTTKQELDNSELTKIKAKGFVSALENIVSQVLVREYVEPKPRENRDERQRSKQNNEGYSAPENTQSRDYDEDIPWG